MKHYIYIIAAFVSTLCYTQNLTGVVYDSETKETLMGASIYYEGTTIGTITNQDGQFSLPVNKNTSAIIASYLGYKDAIVNSARNKAIVTIYLTPKPEALSQVVIQANPPFTRAQMLKAFKIQFLGTTKAGKSCSILNEDVLDFYYDVNTNKMSVTADAALILENPYLGYQIRYSLYECTIQYFKKSIASLDQKTSYYAGTTFFIDKQKGVKKYERRREKAYIGSSLHLMRTIAKENWENEKFMIFKKRFPVNPYNYFIIKDTLGHKKVSTTGNFSVLYKKKQPSKITLKYDYFFIDTFGNFKPADALYFGGNMGSQRMGNILPLNYNL